MVAGDIVEVSALAVANWGNGELGGQSNWVDVTIPNLACGDEELAGGRFTGGGSQVRVGEARITRGLTIHCDLLLSNNLEVNWGGNKFHMTEHLTTVACTDDPAIIQDPPPAPLDTLVGVGTGRYNGTDGYTIEFTLVDYGEPGSSDRAALRIYKTSDPAEVVLNLPLPPEATCRPTTTSHTSRTTGTKPTEGAARAGGALRLMQRRQPLARAHQNRPRGHLRTLAQAIVFLPEVPHGDID